jgi:solute carrier family 50 protein (sugar transporter)
MSWEIDLRVANGIALLGSVVSIVMWLAPVRDVWTAPYSIYKSKSTENVATGFGFVAGTFNCILWNLFACTRLDTMIVPFIVNSTGFFLNISFVICYFAYGEAKARRETRNQLLVMILVTLTAIIAWAVEGDNEVVGYFAAGVNILMLFGPLAAANQVIQARSSKGMSVIPMIMTVISSIAWFCYGVYIKEIPAMLPNGLGIFFGIAQLILYGWAKKQERKLLDDTDILHDEFAPVSGGRPTPAQRQRVSSLGVNVPSEGP